MTAPGVVHAVVTIAGVDRLYALRDDGAVFILVRAGDLVMGQPQVDPYWAMCPPVPGTIAAVEQQG